jgi:NADH-quinone oxidoreductase subunit A
MTSLVAYLLLFLAVAFGFIFVHLVIGKLIRPAKPYAEKLTIYECGEPTIGSAWIQFDLRFYVVALLFVIFDVEVAFFFPWAIVFGQANTLAAREQNTNVAEFQTAQRELGTLLRGPASTEPGSTPLTSQETQATARRLSIYALGDIIVFFGVLLVGYAYLWKRGDLAWVRSTIAERAASTEKPEPSSAIENGAQLAGVGRSEY